MPQGYVFRQFSVSPFSRKSFVDYVGRIHTKFEEIVLSSASLAFYRFFKNSEFYELSYYISFKKGVYGYM